MRYFFCLLILMSVPRFAYAQENKIAPECRSLTAHKADVGVDYKPGVDVKGRPVVPADINAAVIDVPDMMVVPLSIDLAKRLPSASAKGVDMAGTAGFLEVWKNGRITYNGQDVTPQVYLLCGQKMPENLAPAKPVEDGQTPADVIKSTPVKETPAAPVLQVPKKEPPKGKLIRGGEYND